MLYKGTSTAVLSTTFKPFPSKVKTMLFSIAFIFCLFFVTAVGRTPLAGEIVEIRTHRLDAYYEYIDAKKLDWNNYRLAVFVSYAGPNDVRKYGSVIPVIPENAPSEIFPPHLRRNVKEYFNGRDPEIPGFESANVLKGYFDLTGSQPVWSQDDLKLSTSHKQTIMSNDKRQEMIKQFTENIYLNGMPELPLQGVNLDLANAKNQDTLKIKPGQVVKFEYGAIGDPHTRPVVPGIAVCWVGRGKMAIIAILAEVEGSKELETINGHDFRNLDPRKPVVTSGGFNLSDFRFVQHKLLKPQRATFNNKATFDRLVETINENMKRAKKEKDERMAMERQAARQSLAVQSGDSSNGKAAAVSSPWKAQGANNKAAGPSSRVQNAQSGSGSKNRATEDPDWRDRKAAAGPSSGKAQGSGSDAAKKKAMDGPSWRVQGDEGVDDKA